ncbi:probable glycosyltransferase At3g07620 [Juglans microcarpa x Juglans regia]|uniref:probable glycosyltransferase At3g07620 n=1 Tax=Juglans microcarpa x Juglans regia TaxID=2249226 RepID=UPI001B7F583D|nr:probable glycosyltransferase At3g07620 [Juglans microcarpa x Juglans regia]XP_041019295.1 probable glycosyltransferase At3g07620 [Juglans microcarpa x Juglans regia]
MDWQVLCQVETRRLLWLMGMMFAVITAFQYFELPYGNALWSLFSADQHSAVGNSSFQIRNSPPEPEMIGNMTLLNVSNSTNTSVVNETANNTGMSKVMDGNDLKNGLVSDRNGDPNKSLGLDENDDVNKEVLNRNSTILNTKDSGNRSAPEEAVKEPQQGFHQKKNNTDDNLSVGKVGNGTVTPISELIGNSGARPASPLPATSPMNASPKAASPIIMDIDIRTPAVDSNTSLEEKIGKTTPVSDTKPGQLQSGLTPSANYSSGNGVPKVTKGRGKPPSVVVSISEMNELLLRSHSLNQSMVPEWSSAVDQEILYVKSLIENAPIVKNDLKLHAPLYRNVSIFKRSYELMEDILKVYIYSEGEKPIFHQPLLTGIYASEGWFMKLLEANKKFVTKDPAKAHLFYLPFSSRMLELTLYVPNSHSRKNLIQYLKNYLDMIAAKHPFWNRTGGADHFLVACHDWALEETRKHMNKCIRALCNADMKGFVLGKDVSLPETLVRSPQNLLRELGGKPPSKRSILAFFAGSMHGYLRPILLQNWGEKDPDMKIFGRMPYVKGNKNYIQHMKSSKYCICAKGYEVNSPRVVEAIFYECVPVIISDNFVPPFFEVLNWESFAVFVLEKDIPNLKSILLSIPKERYLELHIGVKKVQMHFLWHAKPVKYDIFYMILHSIWYNRLNQISHR